MFGRASSSLTNLRLIRLFVLALLLIAGGATAIQLSWQLKEHADSMTRYVRVDTWAVQQLEYELQQFRTGLTRYIAADDVETLARVRARLTKARATVALLKRGPNYQDFRLLVDIDGAAATTTEALSRIEVILNSDESFRYDLTALQTIETLLTKPSRQLRQLAIDLAHVRAELQDGDLQNVQWLTGINRWMLIGFGSVVCVFIAFLISEIRAARSAERLATANEKRTRYVAEHDQLTGLPNRIVFRRELETAIEEARASATEFALYILNIDGFKEFNDAFGRSFGDSLLIAAAERLRSTIAESDQMYRLGGDEFAVLQRMHGASSDWEETAVSLLAACERAFGLDGRDVHISASIGIARFPGDSEVGESLLKCADLALTEAKKEGRCLTSFEPAMLAEIEKRKQLEEDLRIALTGEGIDVFFQAQVDLSSGRCIGAESLVRWNHETMGWVSPADFIPIAEESGLILPLGRLVLEKACEAALAWPGPDDTVVAVNVSPSQFTHQNIVEEVRDVLAKTGLPARRLELEVTEGLLMRDERAAIATLSSLHELGVQLAIDDFGTGYSSLNYLKQFKVDKLKIDQSFVRDLVEDQDDQKIVRSVVDLGRGLGMKVIAEGIEEAEHVRILSRLGCDEGQGYFFSKPIPSAAFNTWLEEHEAACAANEMPGIAAQS